MLSYWDAFLEELGDNIAGMSQREVLAAYHDWVAPKIKEHGMAQLVAALRACENAMEMAYAEYMGTPGQKNQSGLELVMEAVGHARKKIKAVEPVVWGGSPGQPGDGALPAVSAPGEPAVSSRELRGE